MSGALWLLAVLIAAAAMLLWQTRRRRARLAALHAPLPPAWRALLERDCPLYRRLPDALKQELDTPIRAFIARIPFEGCDGQLITDQVRLLIAAPAVLLIRRAGWAAYRQLYSVQVYPQEFEVVESFEDDLTGVVTEHREQVAGQAHDTDRILISWRDVLEPVVGAEPYNVVIHEFAHYLDHSSGGHLSGTGWDAVWEQEFAALRAAAEHGIASLIDPYGAEDRSEFFAVASECFLEAPRRMQAQHPSLYAQLRDFYELDPASWEARV